MPQRPDLRQIAGNIGDALADYDRDALLAILTYVFKEYVVEGPPPMLVNQAERLEDLEGFSFAQLISALQTRLDHSELSLLKVDGETVSVRIDGVLHPLTQLAAQNASRRGPAAAAPAAPARQAPASAAAPAPRPGVRVVETTLTRRPATPGERVTVADAVERGRSEIAGGPPATAPRPRRGLSVGARPQSGGGTMMPGGGRSDSSSSETAKPEPPPPPEAPEDTGDDSSIRFSLLEFD